jgi:hypothetical protein
MVFEDIMMILSPPGPLDENADIDHLLAWDTEWMTP